MTKNNEKTMLGEFIYERRKELGFTQQELADKLSISNKAVSKWENFETNPDLSVIVKLAEVLKVTTDELLNCSMKKSEIDNLTETIDTNQKKITGMEKPKRRDSVKLVFNILFSVVFFLAAIFMTISTLLAFGSNQFETRSEQLTVIIISMFFLIVFGIICALLVKGIKGYHDKYIGFSSEITEICGYIIFANLSKKEKRTLYFQYLKDKKVWWILFLAGIIIYTFAGLLSYIVDIAWISRTLLIAGYSMFSISFFVNIIQRQKWFLGKKIVLSKKQLIEIAKEAERKTE